MAKLIGTGKDPSLLRGVDFDVRDEEVEHYVSEGLGVPVDDEPIAEEPVEASEPDESPEPVEDLSGLTRPELNERAEAAGVESPKSLPNKEAVADAIREAEAGADSEE